MSFGDGDLRARNGCIGSLRSRTSGRYHQMRKEKGERSGGKGGAWPHLCCRFRAETPADASDSGEEFHRPGGISCRRRWGRRPRLLIGVAVGKKRAGIEAGAKISPATVSSEE
jgi:hypothetical protein